MLQPVAGRAAAKVPLGPPTGLAGRRVVLALGPQGPLPSAGALTALRLPSGVRSARERDLFEGGLPPAVPQVVAAAVDRAAVPVALLGVMAIFLLVQSRLDRRDPKLAVTWRRDDEELTFRPARRSPSAQPA